MRLIDKLLTVVEFCFGRDATMAGEEEVVMTSCLHGRWKRGNGGGDGEWSGTLEHGLGWLL